MALPHLVRKDDLAWQPSVSLFRAPSLWFESIRVLFSLVLFPLLYIYMKKPKQKSSCIRVPAYNSCLLSYRSSFSKTHHNGDTV